jgi:hypothetical protein
MTGVEILGWALVSPAFIITIMAGIAITYLLLTELWKNMGKADFVAIVISIAALLGMVILECEYERQEREKTPVEANGPK